MRSAVLVLGTAFALAAIAPRPGAMTQAQPEDVQAFVGARILPIVGDDIDDGVLIVRGGKIAAIGPRDQLELPADAVIHDLTGKQLMPGLICTHSHIGEPWGADGSDPIQPAVRNYDGINVRAASVQRARAGGITTVNIMSGSGHLMSGQTTYVKLRDGGTIDELALRYEDGRVMGGMKMANGTNSRDDPPFPGTRAKSAALVREAFVEAQEYIAKIARAGDDPSKLPDRNLELEALAEVLSGQRVVHHHTHRHDDILTVLRLAEEFGFRVVLHHVSDGWKVADEIAAAGVPVSMIVIDAPGGKLEAVDLSLETGAILERAGVLTAFHTDDGINDSRLFLRSAALSVRAGMSRQGALRGVTLAGATILDLADRVGSLEVGKDADLVVLSGDPLSVSSLVEQTWVEGALVFDIDDPEDRLYAYGGEGASHGMLDHAHGCCREDDR